MKKYAIWQNGKVIDYIELTSEQAQKLNGIHGIGLHFGFDKVTNPESTLTAIFQKVKEEKMTKN